MASGTIVAESLRTAGREGKLVREHAFNPRSSNGRTAAFGAVNRGSNPCRGASHFRTESLPALVIETLDTARTPGVSVYLELGPFGSSESSREVSTAAFWLRVILEL